MHTIEPNWMMIGTIFRDVVGEVFQKFGIACEFAADDKIGKRGCMKFALVDPHTISLTVCFSLCQNQNFREP